MTESFAAGKPPQIPPMGKYAKVGSVVVVLGMLGWVAVDLVTDHLWFGSVGYTSVFWTQLITKVLLGVVGAVVAGGVPFASMWLARRVSPPSTAAGGSQLTVALAELVRQRPWPLLLIPSLVLGFVGAAFGASQVEEFLAWSNAQQFGWADPIFGLDASFHVFAFPWWRALVSFVSTVLAVTLVLTTLLHHFSGALRAGPLRRTRGGDARPTMSRAANIHLSVLAALLLTTYGLDTLLDRWGLAVTDNSLFTGVSYTDDKARAMALMTLAIIAFLCAALFVANTIRRFWLTPVVAVALLVVSGLILSLIYPLGMQAFWVRPSEPTREAPYIDKHIQSTRYAYGLENVKIEDYSAQTTAKPGQLKADAEALPGIRLIDPLVVGRTFDQLQQVRGYYTFPQVLDVDRYTVDGTQTDAVVAAREIDLSGLPDRNWNNVHTVYTHGYGLAAAYGNKRQPGGEPEWLARDIPPTGKLKQIESRIYFGELQNHFVVTGSREGADPIELDTPGTGAGGEAQTTYTGKGGISVGNPLVRLLYALKFSDANLLLSDRVHGNSSILYDRTPVERVRNVAPWLTTDGDPYPTVVDGRLVWIVDAYTRSNTFPNSQRVELRATTKDRQSLASASTLQTDEHLNYVRNSVKAVVDAYDGSVTLYEWDTEDPVLQTWRKAYPDTVKDKSEISDSLMAHLRYPEDLFKVQRHILGRYHMTNPKTWYEQSDLWIVPEDPLSSKDGVEETNGLRESAFFLSIKWPGDEAPVFSVTTTFVPKKRNNLAAFMSVVADPQHPQFGSLRVLRMSDSQQIDGPGQSFNAMTTNEKVAERLRPFQNKGTASTIFGNLLTIPLGGGLMYVTPVYTQREGASSSAYPVLRFVIVRFGDTVAIGDTLQAALDEVFQGNAGADTDETATEGGGGTGTDKQPDEPASTEGAEVVRTALKQADAAFVAADAALKRGDLAEYQKQIELVRKHLQDAAKAQG